MHLTIFSYEKDFSFTAGNSSATKSAVDHQNPINGFNDKSVDELKIKERQLYLFLGLRFMFGPLPALSCPKGSYGQSRGN